MIPYPLALSDNVQWFLPTSNAAATTTWDIYHVPKNARELFILCVGAGGSGGNGFTRTAGTAGGGGGGGGGGLFSRLWIPTILLPNVLYITAGIGRQGFAGGESYVSLAQSTTAPNTLLRASGGGLGGSGSAGGAGTAGTAPGSVTTTSGIWAVLGLPLFQAGSAGSAGGAQTGAVGVAVTWGAISPASGGAGGAGCTTTDFAGGAITSSNELFPNIPGGTAAGGFGGAGMKQLTFPFRNSGGAGGGSNNSGVGGNGGDGGYGCGGGGGGAGATGGTGGKGGDGFVMILAIT
jgi:hypothetical protein